MPADEWAHEIKLDGYRMHARVDRGGDQPLTRTGMDWTAKYRTTATAVRSLGDWCHVGFGSPIS
jgi:ATP-dependent DNA ligase